VEPNWNSVGPLYLFEGNPPCIPRSQYAGQRGIIHTHNFAI